MAESVPRLEHMRKSLGLKVPKKPKSSRDYLYGGVGQGPELQELFQICKQSLYKFSTYFGAVLSAVASQQEDLRF